MFGSFTFFVADSDDSYVFITLTFILMKNNNNLNKSGAVNCV